ncbi:exonuclease SbcC [Ancylobacter sp. 3268]|uniref:AAA family ATPase n=1 Tax=Ancylobacter sp. 3268 TaxID=2817752 RepID=UPI0028632900|nr:AAA family ATPase [Ancylobacter sp. 3268]MDR6955509.1 exonuclease SbcC [Ancylobacter sp. 3268]
MSIRLSSILVEDFRSIRGPQRISLDAPAVLIHGPNGTGKTSLLSAIELGLTGAVASLGRFDPDYLKYLPHKKSSGGKCRVVLEGEGLKDPRAELIGNETGITGTGLLTDGLSRFFTERCYLPQAALGRLLEIYEHQDSRRSDSPLTRFVKELLGLEPLDSLIDGLHASGDVRRLRAPAPLYTAARSGAGTLNTRVTAAQMAAMDARAAVVEVERELRILLEGFVPPETPLTADAFADELGGERDGLESRLQELARRRRDLSAAASQLASALSADIGGQVEQAEAAASTARAALERWQAGPGKMLHDLFAAIRTRFPDLPDAASNPAATHDRAAKAVNREVERLQTVELSDAATVKELGEVDEAIRQGNARVKNIDVELEQDKGANQELAQALTAISNYIDDENCPVCGRDYREISDTPLGSHVSEEIQRLVAAASRVQGLVRDRSTTSGAVAQAERRRGELASRQLTVDQRDANKIDLAQFVEWRTSLGTLQATAGDGSSLQRQAQSAAGTLSTLNSRRSGLSGLRAELTRHADELGRPRSPDDTPLQVVLSDLTEFVQREIAAAEERLEKLGAIETTFEVLSDAGQNVADAEAELREVTEEQSLLTKQREEADRRITAVRELAGRAQVLRTEKVRQVFNDELNSVWRELFIRLAPDEEFVPAFAVPEAGSGKVEAVLETLYRSGGKGGNPRSMLSAGNLNTAALTLFLALNLSAKPLLPWLIIDDPVQSMDDVHIVQFAALLRTLKHQGRQVFLAVHDRQLFDYLALELSPAFNGDRLITIELGRTADGMTTAPWALTVFEPDQAVAA